MELDKKENPILRRPKQHDRILDVENMRKIITRTYEKGVLWDLFAKGKDASWTELALSFKLVYELLVFVLHDVARLKEQGNRLILSPSPGPSLDLIRNHFRSAETWCSPQVDYLCHALSYSALIYLTGFIRMARSWIDHNGCNEHDGCVAFNIEIGRDFVTAHAAPDCHCQHVGAPDEERTRILEHGGIPVLSCKRDDQGVFDLHFVPASPDLKYVAISHLWADGLGNAFGNSLPHCQLERLVQAVHQANHSFKCFTKDTLLWLDVYCIPAQSPKLGSQNFYHETPEECHQKALKHQAIARMGATYAWANFVMVIDRELMRVATRASAVPWPGKDAAEKNKRVSGPRFANTMAIASLSVSAWNSRCWTYQEHAFAKRSVLLGDDCQLQVGSYLPEGVLESNFHHEFLGLASRQSTMGGGLTAHAVSEVSCISYSSNFTRAWNSFHGRNTSQWEDMIAVLANLLDLDATSVLKLHPEGRMKSILGAQSTLPLSLLFVDLTRLGMSSHTTSLTWLEDRWIPKHIQSVRLNCPENGDLIEVRRDGLLLGSQRLQQNNARIIRLPWQDQATRSAFDFANQADQPATRFWLKVDSDQIRACAKASFRDPKEIILVLELLDPRTDLDDSITLRGACLIPAGPMSRGIEPAVYVCPLECGLSGPESSGDLYHANGHVPRAQPLDPHSGVLIQSGTTD